MTLSVPVKNSSSKTNGTATASAKGQPTIAPVAKARVAKSVRRMLLLLGGSIAYAIARVLAYIAKDEGRNAEVLSQYVWASMMREGTHLRKQSTFRHCRRA